MTTTPSSKWIGRDLGNYHLVRLIGRGGMGMVFEAYHRFLRNRVALKVLHGRHADDPKAAQRFMDEAMVINKIDHPAIVKALDFGEIADGGFYFVMELLEGLTLTQRLADGPLAEPDAARIAGAVAEGLAAAHERGVVHRDLKPDNLFLVEQRVKILDFGLAKMVADSGASTLSDALVGTPKYMAPEQTRSARSVTAQTDVYALGVVLYRMVTGQVPFDGQVMEIVLRIASEEPTPPSRVRAVSPEMERLILDCMCKVPSGRPDGMPAVRARLARWIGEAAPPKRGGRSTFLLPASAVPAARPEPSAGLANVAPPPASIEEPTLAMRFERSTTHRTSRRRTGFLVGLGAVAAIATALSAVALLRPALSVPVAPAPLAVSDGLSGGALVGIRSGTATSTEPAMAVVQSVDASASGAMQAVPVPMNLGSSTISPPGPSSPGGAFDVVIESRPPGAKISCGGVKRGDAPRTVHVDHAPLECVLRLPGYRAAWIKLNQVGARVIDLSPIALVDGRSSPESATADPESTVERPIAAQPDAGPPKPRRKANSPLMDPFTQ